MVGNRTERLRASRTALLGLALWALALTQGAQGEPPAAAPRPAVLASASQLMTPMWTLAGGQVVEGMAPGGMPSAFAPTRGYQPFVRPVAAAAQGPDVYVADAGTGAIWRYDLTLQRMAPLPGVRALVGTKLAVGADRSLYVLDPTGRRVLQFANDGRPLATLGDALNLGRPVGLAFDPRGRVLIADGMFQQLVAFHAFGGTPYVLPLRAREARQARNLAGIAADAQGLYLSDLVCHCVLHATLEGEIIERYGEEHLEMPGAIAADGMGRVFVVDNLDGALRVFEGGGLAYELKPAEVGLVRIDDVWIGEGIIVLSDGMGARVQVARLVPPGKG